MPTLKMDAPQLEGLDFGLDIVSQLPEVSDVIAGGVPQAWGNIQAQWASSSAAVYGQATQQVLGGIITRVGIPAHELREIGNQIVNVYAEVLDAFELASDRIRDEFIGILTRLDLEKKLANAGVTLGANAAAAIPIIGAVVRLVISVVQIAVQAARAQKEQPRIYPATQFDADQDSVVFRAFLETVQSTRDWTGLWSPPAWQQTRGAIVQSFSFQTLESKGVRIVTNNPEPGAIGCVPNTDTLHGGLEIWLERNRIVDTGQFLPTSQQQGTWLFKQLQAEGPSLFCVNADALRGRWADYFYNLRVWLRESPKVSRRLEDAVVKYFRRTSIDLPYAKDFESRGISARASRDFVEHLLPLREAAGLERQQKHALQTLTCAYVDETFAGLQMQRWLRATWEDNRRKLLEHPARFEVDLSNVPDPEYRKELARRGVPAIPRGSFDIAGPSIDDAAQDRARTQSRARTVRKTPVAAGSFPTKKHGRPVVVSLELSGLEVVDVDPIRPTNPLAREPIPAWALPAAAIVLLALA